MGVSHRKCAGVWEGEAPAEPCLPGRVSGRREMCQNQVSIGTKLGSAFLRGCGAEIFERNTRDDLDRESLPGDEIGFAFRP